MSSYKLNVEGAGSSIALLKSDKKASKKYTPMISLGKGSRSGFEELSLNKGETLSMIPDITKERDVLFVIGQSGSGKSYFVSNYAKEYKKLHSKRSIYVFSTLAEDKDGLDRIPKIIRIPLNADFTNDDIIPTEEFKDSLVIFDDIDNLHDKKTKEVVWKYLNNFLQTGRHYKISLCITFHVGCAGASTKMILNEATSITYFPATIGGRNLKYLLDSYLGMDKKQIDQVKKIDSRAITIIKCYPKVVLAERNVYILRND